MVYYAILPIEKLHLADWSQLDQDRDTARKNIAGTHVIVSFLKAYKDEFVSATECEAYGIIEFQSILNTPEWILEDDLD